ncbi:hypothetical protein [Actinomadura rayongensis]|uniref:Uncharacterized protein n=1 Tax=Actinomadura rayongensis TaxID=1429076 RepID=A0A6I4W3Z2_9ACTN|nr:hypothetical protein [Actinomadura rayongensis]MXQ63145.1 hypothetical protein [Actinomadura rayongensis]
MDIRSEALNLLGTPGVDPRFADPYLPSTIRTRTGCRPHQVWEALWGLVAEGLAYLDPSQQPSTDNWRWKLTEAGMQAIEGGSWEPRDTEGYLRRLKHRIPDLDPAAVRYVKEALRAFNARCYLASSVMLGVASERVFTGLANSVVAALGSSADKLKTALDNPKHSQHTRFLELRKRLEPMRAQLPDDLGDSLTLDAVGDLLRVTRNDAGHPTGREVDEDTAYTHLQMAARYLEKMTALQHYFDGIAAAAQVPPRSN